MKIFVFLLLMTGSVFADSPRWLCIKENAPTVAISDLGYKGYRILIMKGNVVENSYDVADVDRKENPSNPSEYYYRYYGESGDILVDVQVYSDTSEIYGVLYIDIEGNDFSVPHRCINMAAN